MRKVLIKSVILHNFKSFSDTSVDFTDGAGLRFLGGENLVEPRLGANGTGKSSLWDALVWCPYGKTPKGLTQSDVLAWGADSVAVSTVYEIDGQEVAIIRYGPPARLEIQIGDGRPTPATQDEVDALLGLSYSRFCHSVVFGQGTKLFPDLKLAERAELFDEVLDLDVWTRCSEKASARAQEVEKELQTIRQERAGVEGAISGLMTDEAIYALIAEWQSKQLDKIALIQLGLEKWNLDWQAQLVLLGERELAWQGEVSRRRESAVAEVSRLEAEQLKYAAPFQSRVDEEKYQQDEQFIKDRQKISQRLHVAVNMHKEQGENGRKEVFRLEGNPICPTCAQPLSEHKLREALSKLYESTLLHDEAVNTGQIEVDNYDLVTMQRQHELAERTTMRTEDRLLSVQHMATYTRLTRELGVARQQRDAVESVNPWKAELTKHEEKVNPYVQQLEALRTETNPHIGVVEQRDAKRKQLDWQLGEIDECLKALEETSAATSYWKTGFKRIRLFFVQKILEALEIEIASALSALGLDGWKITLLTETENKSGTMKLGIQIVIKSISGQVGLWEQWSGGESQRLRLAMAKGLASLIQRAGGVWYDLEVWDEPSNWLSELGIEDLLAALDYRAEVQQKRVWLVDHRALAFNFFETWIARKDAHGTTVHKLAESTL